MNVLACIVSLKSRVYVEKLNFENLYLYFWLLDSLWNKNNIAKLFYYYSKIMTDKTFNIFRKNSNWLRIRKCAYTEDNGKDMVTKTCIWFEWRKQTNVQLLYIKPCRKYNLYLWFALLIPKTLSFKYLLVSLQSALSAIA